MTLCHSWRHPATPLEVVHNEELTSCIGGIGQITHHSYNPVKREVSEDGWMDERMDERMDGWITQRGSTVVDVGIPLGPVLGFSFYPCVFLLLGQFLKVWNLFPFLCRFTCPMKLNNLL